MSKQENTPDQADITPPDDSHAAAKSNSKLKQKEQDASAASIKIVIICVAIACCILLFLAFYGIGALLGLVPSSKQFESNVVTKTVTTTPTTNTAQAEESEDWLFTELNLRNFRKLHEVTQNDNGKGIRRIQANVGECRVELRFTPSTKELTLPLANGDIMKNPTAYKVAQEEEFAECARAFPEFDPNTPSTDPDILLDTSLPIPSPTSSTPSSQ